MISGLDGAAIGCLSGQLAVGAGGQSSGRTWGDIKPWPSRTLGRPEPHTNATSAGTREGQRPATP